MTADPTRIAGTAAGADASRADATRADGPWGTIDLPVGASTRLDIGPLGVALRREPGELWVVADREQQPGGPAAGEGVPEQNWIRWAATSAAMRVGISPTFADRPLVVAPEVPFRLVPGVTARIYVRIPLWVRVTLAGPTEVVLVEEPTVVMSDTWWGDLGTGELAYWLPTRARRQIDDTLFEPHLVMCPLDLENESDDVLTVEGLAIRVMHMSIFRSGSQLWANETLVRYEDEPEGSRIDMAERPPEEVRGAQLLALPREKVPRGLRATTFAKFKSITGF